MFRRLAAAFNVRAAEADSATGDGEESEDTSTDADPQQGPPRKPYRRVPYDPALLSQYQPTRIPWLSSSPEEIGLGDRGRMATYLEECTACRWISGLTFIGAGVYVYMATRWQIRYLRQRTIIPLVKVVFSMGLGIAGLVILIDPQKQVQDDWVRKYDERQRRLRVREERVNARIEQEEAAAAGSDK